MLDIVVNARSIFIFQNQGVSCVHCLHQIVLFYCTNNGKVPMGQESHHFYGITAIKNTVSCMIFDMKKMI